MNTFNETQLIRNQSFCLRLHSPYFANIMSQALTGLKPLPKSYTIKTMQVRDKSGHSQSHWFIIPHKVKNSSIIFHRSFNFDITIDQIKIIYQNNTSDITRNLNIKCNKFTYTLSF